MTKQQFYKNCLTEEGREIIDQEFNTTEAMLKGYYKKDLDLKDINNWDEIIYMPKYAKVNTIDGYFDEEEANYEILEEKDWKVYTFLDLLKSNYHLLEGKMNKLLEDYAKSNNINLPKDYNDLVEWTIKQYNELKGEDIMIKKEIEEKNVEDKKEQIKNDILGKLSPTELSAYVNKLLAKLDKQEADIVRMRFIDRRKEEDIAKLYGTTHDNIHKIVNSALKELQKILLNGEM